MAQRRQAEQHFCLEGLRQQKTLSTMSWGIMVKRIMVKVVLRAHCWACKVLEKECESKMWETSTRGLQTKAPSHMNHSVTGIKSVSCASNIIFHLVLWIKNDWQSADTIKPSVIPFFRPHPAYQCDCWMKRLWNVSPAARLSYSKRWAEKDYFVLACGCAFVISELQS